MRIETLHPTPWRHLMLAGILTLAVLPTAGETEEPPPFSHDIWTQVLERSVDDEGRVDYRGLAADRVDLDRYLASLAAVSPKSHPDLFPTRQDALAYYLNAYNAQVFAGVLKLDLEIESVWPTLWAGYQFFMRHKFTLGGAKFHLKGLEDNQVREQFKDPRIHAFLNCASTGCPRLPRKAIEPATLDEELDAAMAEFVLDGPHLRLEAAQETVYLSKIFEWFDKDFLSYERSQGNARPNLLDYVNRFRGSEAQIPREFNIRFLPYDKSLNRQSPSAAIDHD